MCKRLGRTLFINAACVTLLASGCAIPAAREYRQWDQDYRAKAQAGEVQWSAYYAAQYDRLKTAPDWIGYRGLRMRQALALQDAAQSLESGQITKADFERKQREAEAELQMARDAEGQAMSAGAAARPVPQYKPPVRCYTSGTSTICR